MSASADVWISYTKNDGLVTLTANGMQGRIWIGKMIGAEGEFGHTIESITVMDHMMETIFSGDNLEGVRVGILPKSASVYY